MRKKEAREALITQTLEKYDYFINSIAVTMKRSYRFTYEQRQDIVEAAKLRICAAIGKDKIDFKRSDAGRYIKRILVNSMRDELRKILKHSHSLSLDSLVGELDESPGSRKASFANRLLDQRNPSEDMILKRMAVKEALEKYKGTKGEILDMFCSGWTAKGISAELVNRGRPVLVGVVRSVINQFKKECRELCV